MVEAKFASVGKPFYFTVAKLIDDDGAPITAPNTPGELLWSGPQIFSGYWGNEEETAKTLVDGWVHTGDMASVDDDGFYYIVGLRTRGFPWRSLAWLSVRVLQRESSVSREGK